LDVIRRDTRIIGGVSAKELGMGVETSNEDAVTAVD
jgi:hypothetical protein